MVSGFKNELEARLADIRKRGAECECLYFMRVDDSKVHQPEHYSMNLDPFQMALYNLMFVLVP